MKNPFLLAIVALFISMSSYAQQDYQFTQFWNAPLMLNPALTGDVEGYRLRFNTNHAINIDNRTIAEQLSIDYRIPVFKKDYIGIGGQAFFDYNYGRSRYRLNSMQSGLSMAYHKGFGQRRNGLFHHLSIGVQGYYAKHSVFDLGYYANQQNHLDYYHRLDADLGINWTITPYSFRGKRGVYTFGVSLGHLNQSIQPFAQPDSILKLYPRMKLQGHTSTSTKVSRLWTLYSQCLFTLQPISASGKIFHYNHQRYYVQPYLSFDLNKGKFSNKLYFGLGVGMNTTYWKVRSTKESVFKADNLELMAILGLKLGEITFMLNYTPYIILASRSYLYDECRLSLGIQYGIYH
jgi:hypothetical protein